MHFAPKLNSNQCRMKLQRILHGVSLSVAKNLKNILKMDVLSFGLYFNALFDNFTMISLVCSHLASAGIL